MYGWEWGSQDVVSVGERGQGDGLVEGNEGIGNGLNPEREFLCLEEESVQGDHSSGH